ncbi:hypothetical protein NH340_JMT06271 [Sarcoptes scabiei]|nr:hypothetical protein NH340_JMT06271 [Sarcoptes scabiei]
MFPDRLSFAMITLISSKESNSMTIERLTSRFILILVILLLIIIKNKQMIRCQQQSTDVGHGDNDVDDQQSNQFDQILKELNILTQQQLDVPRSTTTTTTKQTTTTTTTVTDDSSSSKTLSKQSMDNNDHRTEKINEIKPNNQQLRMGSRNFDQFRLPDGYDVNKPPKFSKSNPIKIIVNLTVLDTTIDKHENVIILDLKIDECWKDKRFRIKKNGAKNSNNGNHSLDDDDYEIDESDLKRQENHLLESEWLNKIWHPISRLRNNAHVTNALFDKPKQTLQKTIEQEKLIEKIHIQSNSTTAWVWISLKMRVNIPIYECRRDDSRIYPFDRIRCSFHIANGIV